MAIKFEKIEPGMTWTAREMERLYTKPTKAYLAQQERQKGGGLW